MKGFKVLIIIGVMLHMQIAYGYINVYPTKFDKEIRKEGSFHEITLSNPSMDEIRYSITLKDLKGNDNHTGDMASWTEIYPTLVTVRPGRKSNVKMLITPPEGVEDGEYGMILNIKQLNTPNSIKEKEGAVVSMLLDVNMGMYGYVGKVNGDYSKSNLKFVEKNDMLIIEGIIENSGDRSPRTILSVSNKDGKEEVKRIGRIWKGRTLDVSVKIEELEDANMITIYEEDNKENILYRLER